MQCGRCGLEKRCQAKNTRFSSNPTDSVSVHNVHIVYNVQIPAYAGYLPMLANGHYAKEYGLYGQSIRSKNWN